jgi:hypothetical protein
MRRPKIRTPAQDAVWAFGLGMRRNDPNVVDWDIARCVLQERAFWLKNGYTEREILDALPVALRELDDKDAG